MGIYTEAFECLARDATNIKFYGEAHDETVVQYRRGMEEGIRYGIRMALDTLESFGLIKNEEAGERAVMHLWDEHYQNLIDSHVDTVNGEPT